MTRRNVNKLDDKHKTWLVIRWAAYGRGDEVRREFGEEFGFSPPAGVLRKYNLSGMSEDQCKKLGKHKWFDLFTRSRNEFEASIKDIPVANATYRVKRLDEMFHHYFDRKAFTAAAKMLEQAAKETGGAFTNRREVDGQIKHDLTVEEVPMDVKRSTVAQRIREAVVDVLAQAAATQQAAASPETQH